MRRKDREQDAYFAYSVLEKCEYAVLSMVQNGKPYAVPISPVLVDKNIYFHSAIEGEKSRILSKNKDVCVSCVCDTEIVSKDFTTLYKSAVAFGECNLVNGEQEAKKALLLLAQKYACEKTQSAIESAVDHIEKYAHKTAVYKITVQSISGKANLPKTSNV